MQVTGKKPRSPDDMPKWTWLAQALYVALESVCYAGINAVHFVRSKLTAAPPPRVIRRRRPTRD
jgi:hypothetical protein